MSLLCQYTKVLLNELHAEKIKQMEEGRKKAAWRKNGAVL